MYLGGNTGNDDKWKKSIILSLNFLLPDLICSILDSCANGQRLDIDAMTTLVMVVDAEQPTITITGAKNQDVSENNLSHGVKLFPDMVIDARTKTEDSERTGSANSKVRFHLVDDIICSEFTFHLLHHVSFYETSFTLS